VYFDFVCFVHRRTKRGTVDTVTRDICLCCTSACSVGRATVGALRQTRAQSAWPRPLTSVTMGQPTHI
jgi:hypothetical protein